MAAFKACSHQKASLPVCQAFCVGSLMASSQLTCAQELEAHLAQPSVTDWAVLLVGYVVLGCLAMAGLWLYLAWRVVRSGRRGRGLAWAKHALIMAGRQFRGHLIRVGFGAKVSTVMSALHAASSFKHCCFRLVHSLWTVFLGFLEVCSCLASYRAITESHNREQCKWFKPAHSCSCTNQRISSCHRRENDSERALTTVQVVCMLLTELVLLPIAHGYFVHICAWPLLHSRPALYFGISFVLLHWLMGMVSCKATLIIPQCCPNSATYHTVANHL